MVSTADCATDVVIEIAKLNINAASSLRVGDVHKVTVTDSSGSAVATASTAGKSKAALEWDPPVCMRTTRRGALHVSVFNARGKRVKDGKIPVPAANRATAITLLTSNLSLTCSFRNLTPEEAQALSTLNAAITQDSLQTLHTTIRSLHMRVVGLPTTILCRIVYAFQRVVLPAATMHTDVPVWCCAEVCHVAAAGGVTAPPDVVARVVKPVETASAEGAQDAFGLSGKIASFETELSEILTDTPKAMHVGRLARRLSHDARFVCSCLSRLSESYPPARDALQAFSHRFEECAKAVHIHRGDSCAFVAALCEHTAALKVIFSAFMDNARLAAATDRRPELVQSVKRAQVQRCLHIVRQVHCICDGLASLAVVGVVKDRVTALGRHIEDPDTLAQEPESNFAALREELSSTLKHLQWYAGLDALRRDECLVEFCHVLLRHHTSFRFVSDGLHVKEHTGDWLQLHVKATQDDIFAAIEAVLQVQAHAPAGGDLAATVGQLLESLRTSQVEYSDISVRKALLLGALVDPNSVCRHGGTRDAAVPKTLLGAGTFGKVFEGVYCGQRIAVKSFAKLSSSRDKKAFRNEVAIMLRLRHPNICVCLGATHAEEYDAILLELIPGSSLYDELDQVPWRKRLEAMEQVVGALAYLHSKRVVHNDLKAANVMIDMNTYVAKIVDFGIAETKETVFNSSADGKTSAGTLLWTAPELLAATQAKGTAESDMYSFGMLLVEIITGEVPYGWGLRDAPQRSNPSTAIATQWATEGKPPAMPLDDSIVDADEVSVESLRALAIDCLALEPTHRPTADHVRARLQTILQALPTDASNSGEQNNSPQ